LEGEVRRRHQKTVVIYVYGTGRLEDYFTGHPLISGSSRVVETVK
jgi:hypothetical protein